MFFVFTISCLILLSPRCSDPFMRATVLYQACAATTNMRTEDGIRLFEYCVRLRDERKKANDHPAANGLNGQPSGYQIDHSEDANIEIQCDNLFKERSDSSDAPRTGSVTQVTLTTCKSNRQQQRPESLPPPPLTPAAKSQPSASQEQQQQQQQQSPLRGSSSRQAAGQRSTAVPFLVAASHATAASSSTPVTNGILHHNAKTATSSHIISSSQTGKQGSNVRTPYRLPNDISVTVKQEMIGEEDGSCSAASSCSSSFNCNSSEIQFVGQIDVSANGSSDVLPPDHNDWETIDGQARGCSSAVPPVASPTRVRHLAGAAAASTAKSTAAKSYSRNLMFGVDTGNGTRPIPPPGTRPAVPPMPAPPAPNCHVRSILNGPPLIGTPAAATTQSAAAAGGSVDPSSRSRARHRVSFNETPTSRTMSPEHKRFRPDQSSHNCQPRAVPSSPIPMPGNMSNGTARPNPLARLGNRPTRQVTQQKRTPI